MAATPEPGVNDPVVITDANGREHRSRIVSVSPTLTIVRPDDVAAGDPLLVGDEMTLRWPDGPDRVGVFIVTLTAKRYQDELAVWDLLASGPATRQQRRSYVRTPAAGQVVLTAVSALPNGAQRRTEGALLDVSEVALRCAVDGGAAWASRHNATVQAALVLDGEPIEVTGRIVKSGRDSEGRYEIVVMFDQAVPEASPVRRIIAASETAARPR